MIRRTSDLHSHFVAMIKRINDLHSHFVVTIRTNDLHSYFVIMIRKKQVGREERKISQFFLKKHTFHLCMCRLTLKE